MISKPTDDLKDLDVNTAFWCMFVSITLKNCSSSWTRLFTKLTIYQESIFEVCGAINFWQTEIAGLSTTDWNQPLWKESTLMRGRAVQIVKSKTHVFSDSVLCLGGISTEPVHAWKDKKKVFGDTLPQRIGSNWWRADGIRVEKFPRIHYIGISSWDSKHDGDIRKDHLHVHVQWYEMGPPGNEENCTAKC